MRGGTIDVAAVHVFVTDEVPTLMEGNYVRISVTDQGNVIPSDVFDKIFDAVILDLTVRGGMGGKEAVQRLIAIDPGVKGIVSSGYSDDPGMTDFKPYGFSGVVAIPYTMGELGEKLNRVLKS
jgi:hypothetical protein